jgi:tellurite resistance protein
MSDGILKGRERALEEAFFAQQEEALLRRMRDADRNKSRKEAIAAALPITDEALLDRLVELDLGPQSVAALALAPLVFVAWADGSLEPSEKEAVLRAARDTGLSDQPEALALLEHWLKTPPSPQLRDAWRNYAHAIVSALPAESRATVAQKTIGRARAVAEAAGGFLGLSSRVSDAEKKVLAELEKVLAG